MVLVSADVGTQQLTFIANALQRACSIASRAKSKCRSQPACASAKDEVVGWRTRWVSPPEFCLKSAKATGKRTGRR